MLAGLGNFLSRIVQRYLPDALVLAIFITVITFIMGMVIVGQSPLNMITYWGEGIWSLLAYTMQISLVLLTGYIFAHTAPVQAVLKGIARPIKRPATAIMLAAVIGALGSLLSWAFGLIVGALIARELARNVEGVHYPLLVASAYAGFVVWHGGLSASALLTVATPGHFLEDVIGIIPVSKTIYNPANILMIVILVATIPILMRMMMPSKEKIIEYRKLVKEVDKEEEKEEDNTPRNEMQLAQKIETHRAGSLILGGMLTFYTIYYFVTGGGLDLDSLNLTFFSLGVLFSNSPKHYVEMATNAGKNIANVVIQYPLYAAIMGMMGASGLAAAMTDFIVSNTSDTTLSLFTFYAAGLVNLFVPSGGGQWIIQGPIAVEAAQTLGVAIENVALAVAWGDAWTNMIQPFWALPLLAIAGLGIRDIMGYCAVVLIWSGIVISAVMLFML